ncbi:Hexaprenyldihydroxybenzoate methyltransferase, mitochondrial [Rhodotorula toruloides]
MLGLTACRRLARASKHAQLTSSSSASHPTACAPFSNLITSASSTPSSRRTLLTSRPAFGQNTTNTISASEISHFSALSAHWWDPTGEFGLLHRMNPARIEVLRDELLRVEEVDVQGGRWLEGRRVLDVGCGGGIFAESLARLGANALAIDASASNIDTAQTHASLDPSLNLLNSRIPVTSSSSSSTRPTNSLEYRHCAAEDLIKEGKTFDVVCAMEVVEHVEDPRGFLECLMQLTKPGGHLILSTISRTLLAKFLTITLAEDVLRLVTPGTHTYHKYLRPSELRDFFVREKGWEAFETRGVPYDPVSGEWRLLDPGAMGGWGEMANYFAAVRRPTTADAALNTQLVPPEASQKATPAPAKTTGGAKGRKGGAKDDAGKEATPPKKRKTGGRRERERRRGWLRRGGHLVEFADRLGPPEICSDLDPSTLLDISQTSKSIRSTLFRKPAEPVWLAARRNVGMPDLQAEMYEPMYAFLVQGKVCQVCGTTRLKTEAENEFRVRACSKCMMAKCEIDELHPLALGGCLSTPYWAVGNTRADGEHYFWVPEAAAPSDHLNAIDPPPRPEKDEPQPAYNPNDNADSFRNECRRHKVKMIADAATIFAYASRSLDENLAEERRKVDARMQQIRERLVAAGFHARDTMAVPRSYGYGGVPVSHDGWAKIQPEVTTLAARQRQAHLAFERKGRQLERRDKLQPLVAAFDKLPTVRRLWVDDSNPVDPAGWSTLIPTMQAEVCRLLRHDKVWMFDQLARVLHEADIPLHPHVVRVIISEHSASVAEEDESQGLAPLHHN